MTKFYVSNEIQSSGEHIVHKQSCHEMPENSRYLGNYTTSFEAVAKARTLYQQVNGCFCCCPQSHIH